MMAYIHAKDRDWIGKHRVSESEECHHLGSLPWSCICLYNSPRPWPCLTWTENGKCISHLTPSQWDSKSLNVLCGAREMTQSAKSLLCKHEDLKRLVQFVRQRLDTIQLMVQHTNANVYYSIYYPLLNEDEIEHASYSPHIEEPRVQDWTPSRTPRGGMWDQKNWSWERFHFSAGTLWDF